MQALFRLTLAAAISCWFLAPACHAQSAPAAVPLPFSVALAGTGTPATATCTDGIPATNGTDYGDGCTPQTAALDAPQGAAVDSYGNVYVADYEDNLVRVIYHGGTQLAAAITAANTGFSASPARTAFPALVPGDIYTLAGTGNSAAFTATSTDGSGKYACANDAVSGQPDALNSLGDGCPAAAAVISARDVSIDSQGNLFLTDYTNNRIRIFCVNCTASTMAAKLIELEEPGVTPVNGAMYTIAGYSAGYRDQQPGFGNATIASTTVALFRDPSAAVVSTSDDVVIADNLNNAVRLLYNGGTAAKNILTADGYTPQQGYVYTIAGDDCVSAATNKTGSVTTANSCLTTAGNDTATNETPGTPGSSGAAFTTNGTPVGVAWTVYLDANGNVFYSDKDNTRIKVIYGGIAAPLTLPNATYSSLKAGYAYTFAGGGSQTASGVAPTAELLSSPQGLGGDSNGNIFFIDYTTALVYETYAQNGLTAIIGGSDATSAPAQGAFCNGASNGPAMTDAYYNGCPLTQVKMSSPRGPIVADSGGNLYFGDSVDSLLREFAYNPTFPATAVGATSAAQPYAFTFLSAQTLSNPVFTMRGASATVFSNAGSSTCTTGLAATGSGPGITCVINVAFAPQQPGVAAGAVELTSASSVLGAINLSGEGTGAGLNVDPGTLTTTGTNLVPGGIAVDGAGSVLVTDTTSKSLLRYSAGAATTVATGFTQPDGVAIDGAGNIFIADATANTITEIPVTGTKFTFTTNVSVPHGLATDGLGNLYIADTGNNNILRFGPGGTQLTVLGFTGLNAPTAVAVDASGNVYAADSSHIVEFTSAGVQTTIASTAATGLAVDAAGNIFAAEGTALVEYPATDASTPITLSTALITPQALALDLSGNAYVADSGFSGYVEFARTAASYAFTSNPASTSITLTSSGTSTLNAPNYTQTDTTDFSVAASSTNGCNGALAAGTTCTLTADFTPTTASTVTNVLNFSSNATNASGITFTITGKASAQATTTLLGIGTASLVYGSTEALTATVSGTTSTPSSGTVNFYNGTTLLGSANVGTNGAATLTIAPAVGTYSNVTATFEASSGYLTSTSSAGSFSVTPATLTVTANDASKLYNAPNPSLTYSITGFVNSDTQSTAVSGTPTETTTATTSSSAGAYPIAITQGTLSAANYTFTFVNGTLTVTGATTQTITFASLPNTTYGAAPIALSATSSSGLAVTYTATGPATVSGSMLTITGAGNVTVTANQNGNNTYAAATPVSHSFTVSPATLTVTAANASSVYGSALPTLTYSITGFVNSDVQATAMTGTATESTTATTTSSVGPYPISIAQGTLAANNYTFTFTNGTLTITPATLTLTAANATRVYGASNPAFTGTLTGAVNSDQLTETFTTTATVASAPGAYTITPGVSGVNASNYTLAATNGTLSITQATPLVALTSSASSGYNGATNLTLTATVSSPTTGAPSGTVAFYAGTTQIGSATISSGAASIQTTQLPVGGDTITAVYSGDPNFISATSNAVSLTIAAGFSITTTTTSLSFQPSYQEAQAYLTVTPGGRTDTLTFSCTGLPAKLSCAFYPASLVLAGLSTQQSVQLLVSNSAAQAALLPTSSPSHQPRSIAFALLPLAALALFGLRRRKLFVPMLALLILIATIGITGCGSWTEREQSAGTYQFNVVVSSGTTTVDTIPFTLTVPQ